jgi:hypothetical protein
VLRNSTHTHTHTHTHKRSGFPRSVIERTRLGFWLTTLYDKILVLRNGGFTRDRGQGTGSRIFVTNELAESNSVKPLAGTAFSLSTCVTHVFK